MNDKKYPVVRRSAAFGLFLAFLLTLLVTMAAIADDQVPADGGSREKSVTTAIDVADQAADPSASEPSPIPNGLVTSTLLITKSVDPEVLQQGDSRWVTYQVLFTNSSTQAVTLTQITDTLPAGFVYGNPALGDEVGPPADATEPDIKWQDVTVPASGTLTMAYLVKTVERAGSYYNSVVATTGSEQIGPVRAEVRIEGNLVLLPIVYRDYTPPSPVWNMTKTSDKGSVEAGEDVQYTVRIENDGNLSGTFTRIVDALPSKFTFLNMVSGSDVMTPPSGTTGNITWQDSWTLAPGDDLVLIYKVRTGGGGNKVNTVSIHAGGGPALASTFNTIGVGGGGLPYEENFNSQPPKDWQPFTNAPNVDPNRWYAASGYYIYDYREEGTENEGYDMSMYLAAGTEGWTNYRIETRLKDSKKENLLKGLEGVWFRGTYQNSGANDGKSVGGYYLYMKPSDNFLYLGRLNAGSRSFDDWDSVANFYYPQKIKRTHWYDLVIEVRGNRIQVWFGDEADGMTKAIDYTDPGNTWPVGTVGFATYYTVAVFDYMRVLPLSD